MFLDGEVVVVEWTVASTRVDDMISTYPLRAVVRVLEVAVHV